MVPCIYHGVTGYDFQIKVVFFSDDRLCHANRADPDEVLPSVALHLGLHCLPKYAFRSHHYTNG